MSCLPKSKGWTESRGALQEGLYLVVGMVGCDTKHGRTSGGLRDRGVAPGPFQLPRVIMWDFLYIAVLVIGAVWQSRD